MKNLINKKKCIIIFIAIIFIIGIKQTNAKVIDSNYYYQILDLADISNYYLEKRNFYLAKKRLQQALTITKREKYEETATIKQHIYYQFAHIYSYLDNDSSFYFANLGIIAFKAKANPSRLDSSFYSWNLYYLGLFYHQKINLDQAKKYFLASLEVEKELNHYNSNKYNEIENALLNLYLRENNKLAKKIIENKLKIIEIKNGRNSNQYIEALAQQCYFLSNWNNNNKAIKQGLYGLKLSRNIKNLDSVVLATLYNNIGVAYSNKNDKLQNLRYLIKARENSETAVINVNIADAYSDLDSLKLAEQFYILAIKLAIENKSEFQTSLASQQLSLFYKNKMDSNVSLEEIKTKYLNTHVLNINNLEQERFEILKNEFTKSNFEEFDLNHLLELKHLYKKNYKDYLKEPNYYKLLVEISGLKFKSSDTTLIDEIKESFSSLDLITNANERYELSNYYLICRDYAYYLRFKTPQDLDSAKNVHIHAFKMAKEFLSEKDNISTIFFKAEGLFEYFVNDGFFIECINMKNEYEYYLEKYTSQFPKLKFKKYQRYFLDLALAYSGINNYIKKNEYLEKYFESTENLIDDSNDYIFATVFYGIPKIKSNKYLEKIILNALKINNIISYNKFSKEKGFLYKNLGDLYLTTKYKYDSCINYLIDAYFILKNNYQDSLIIYDILNSAYTYASQIKDTSLCYNIQYFYKYEKSKNQFIKIFGFQFLFDGQNWIVEIIHENKDINNGDILVSINNKPIIGGDLNRDEFELFYEFINSNYNKKWQFEIMKKDSTIKNFHYE